MTESLTTQRKPETALAIRAKYALSTYQTSGSGLQALTAFVFPSGFFGTGDGGAWSGMWGEGLLPSISPRDFPYQNVNAYNASVVMACVNWISGAFKEAKPRVYKRQADGTPIELPNHALARLLRRPNPYYTYAKLIGAVVTSYCLTGNAYVFKERADNGVGATTALYYIPHYMIEPRRDGNNQFVSYYLYTVDGVRYRIPPDRIIHFRYDMDIYNTLLGRNPLQPVLSLVYSDEEADRFLGALLRNSAVPGVVIAPDSDKVQIKPEQADRLKEIFIRKFGGDNRGEPFIPTFAAKVFRIGLNPDELDFRNTRRLPEERVAAVYRVAPSAVGLGAGLDRSTFSNYEQAVRSSYEGCLIPMWSEWGEDLTRAFAAEFFTSSEDYYIGYDTTEIKALRESADAVVNRAVKIWLANGSKRSELRAAAGLPVDETEDNVYYRDTLPAPVANNPLAQLPPQPTKLERAVRSVLRLKAAPAANLDNAYAMQLEADVREHGGIMLNGLDGLFSELGAAAQKAAAELDPLNPEAETDRILDAVVKAGLNAEALGVIWALMAEEVRDSVRIVVSLRLGAPLAEAWDTAADAATEAVLKRGMAEYEAGLLKQTREAVREAIKLAGEGQSKAQIARAIRGMVEGRKLYPGLYKEGYDAAKAAGATEEQAIRAGDAKARRYRASVIADAETRTYQNSALLESMAATGKVLEVRVEDGGACGWKYHDDTDKAHGTKRALSEARRFPIVHPNCQRRFFPVTE